MSFIYSVIVGGVGTALVSWYNSSQNVEKKKWQSLEDQAQKKTDEMMAEGEGLIGAAKGKKKRRRRSSTILTGALDPEQQLGTSAPTLTGKKTTIG